MSNPVPCWAPRKVRPKLPSQRIRQSSYVYAAVCPESGDLCSLIMPYSNTDCMQIFLAEFARQRAGKPTLLIMDQAAWHKSSALKTYPNIFVKFQPPYSPELNPVEQLWMHIRTTFTHNTVSGILWCNSRINFVKYCKDYHCHLKRLFRSLFLTG